MAAARGALAWPSELSPDSTVVLRSGHAMPVLGLGTWRSDKAALKHAVTHALSAGYRHIDCAIMYANEDVVGEGLAEALAGGVVSRASLFVATKIMPTQMHPGLVRPALEASLKRLRLGYVDLVYLHWPLRFVAAPSAFPVPPAERLGYDAAAVAETWAQLEACVDAGLVRSLGVSNFTCAKVAALEAAARLPVSVNQLELHPALAQRRVVEWHAARGIVVAGYSPLGSPARPPAFRHGDAEPAPLAAPAVAELAARHGRTPAQVLLRWALQRGTAPLPKSVTPARLDENLGALARGWALSAEDMEQIDGLDEGYRFSRGEDKTVPGQHWSELWADDDALPAAAVAASDAAA